MYYDFPRLGFHKHKPASLDSYKYQQSISIHMKNTQKLSLLLIAVFLRISYGVVSPFDYSTTILTMQDKTPTVFLLTAQAPQKSTTSSNHLYQFHQAASLYYSLHPNKSPQNTKVAEERLLFVVSDPNDGLYTFDRLAQYLGVEKKDTPTIIYLSHTHEKYKLKKDIEITSESVVRFLQDISSGKQPIFYKSESVQSIQNNKSKYVKKLVGSNFNNVLLTSQKECMVIFYVPLDYKSRVVKLQFEKTAQSLRNNKNILFYKVDSTKNEVLIEGSPSSQQLLIKQQDTPLILFFSKNKQKPPIRYSTLKEYENSSDYMIKWLKQTTEFNWVRSMDVSEDFFEEL